MAITSYEDLIDQYIPNFRRFENTLDTDSEVLVDLAFLLKKVYDTWLLESIGKYINLELGLCILKDKEIDQKKLKEIVWSLKSKW